MSDVDLDKCVTLLEAAAELGISRRGMYRVAVRAEAAGEVVRVRKFGHFLFLKSGFPAMRKYHLPHEKQSRLAAEYRAESGAKGGVAKVRNERLRAQGKPIPVKPPRVSKRYEKQLKELLEGLTIEQLSVADDLIKQAGSVHDAARAVKAIAALRRDASSGTAGKEV